MQSFTDVLMNIYEVVKSYIFMKFMNSYEVLVA